MTELTLKTTLDELNASMLEKLKSFFMGDAIVHVRISTIPDETAFLLSTQANRASNACDIPTKELANPNP